MIMPAPKFAYTLAVVGDLEAGRINAVTSALAESIRSFGSVESGDYLDRKNLSGSSKVFHIGCRHDETLIDLINCPLNANNLAIAFCQADRIVWVVQPDEISPILPLAVGASVSFGIQSHSMILNMAGVDAESVDDDELMALMEADVLEMFEQHDTTIDQTVNISVADISAAASAAPELEPFAKSLFASVPDSNSADVPQSGPSAVLQVEQCYGVKGPAGKPVRVAFGPIHGKPIETGDSLFLVGAGDGADSLRVTEIQLFGEKVKQAPPRASAALMLHGAAKRPTESRACADRSSGRVSCYG